MWVSTWWAWSPHKPFTPSIDPKSYALMGCPKLVTHFWTSILYPPTVPDLDTNQWFPLNLSTIFPRSTIMQWMQHTHIFFSCVLSEMISTPHETKASPVKTIRTSSSQPPCSNDFMVFGPILQVTQACGYSPSLKNLRPMGSSLTNKNETTYCKCSKPTS